jgi:hypothetical protein
VNIGPAEFVVIVSLGLIPLAICIWAIVDAASRPQSAWTAIGKSRATWITLIAVFTIFCNLVGFVIAIAYLTTIRNQLKAATT